MPTRFLAVAFATLLFASFGFARVPLLAATAVSGGVYLSTLPSGADVWIDGTYVGRSPVFVDALAVGKHSVTVTKTGWNVQEIDVAVGAGAVALPSLQLLRSLSRTTRAVGRLALHGLPSGSTLTIDGSAAVPTIAGTFDLAGGVHRLIARTPKGTVTRHFTIYPEMTTDVVLREPSAEEPKSTVVAPAEEYLPDGTFTVERKKVVIRYGGHAVVGHVGSPAFRFDGVPIEYDVPASYIGGKLYLPLELLAKLTKANGKTKPGG